MNFPNLSALAVRERSVTLFFILLSIITGIYAFFSIGRSEDPDFKVKIMVVSAHWPGATAREMQEQVADKLEKRIQEVRNLNYIETTIRPGRADLLIVFQGHTHQTMIPELFYQVRKRMQDESLNLPRGVIGPIVNEDFSDVYFSLIALSAPGLPMRELTREAEVMRDRLQRIEGVQKALVLGERKERIYVEFDNARLVNLGISPPQIFDAIEANNRLVSAGYLETVGPRIYLRLDIDLSDPERLSAVPIRIGDSLLRLGDIARIHRGYEDPPSYMIRAHGEDAIVLGVVMRKGENGLEFGKRLSQYIKAESDHLPLGMSITQLTNQAEIIASAINLFQVKFLVSIFIVMGVSFLIIGLRASMVVGIAIPITLGITFILFLIGNIHLDRITLGALVIALGLLVDDVIIAIEIILKKISEGLDCIHAAAHVWTATAGPMLSGTLVTIAGFVPIGFAQSSVGEYTGNIFWVLACALLASLFVAVIFIPYLSVLFLPSNLPKQSSKHKITFHQTLLYPRLRAIIIWCIKNRKTVVVSTISLFVISVAGIIGPVQKQFFPTSDRPEVLVSIFMPQGSAINNTNTVAQRIETILAEMPGIKNFSSYIGAGAPRFFLSLNPEQPNPAFAKIIVVAKNITARDKIITVLNSYVDRGEFPEARVRVTSLKFGPPITWPISFRVLGPDPVRIRGIAYQVRDVMESNQHTRNTHLEWDERAPVLHLTMDVDRLRLMGLTPNDIAQQLQFQLNGIPVTEVRQNIRTVEVFARGLNDTKINLDSIEIRTLDGRKVSLMQVGELQVRYEDPVTKRYNREFFIAVNADVLGAQPNDVTATIWHELELIHQKLPKDYHIEIGGSIEESKKADASIQKLLPLMIILMLAFIMIQMRSFSGTFIVIATAPLGVIGAVATLLLFDQSFGFVALLGLIGLAGILMRNTLILTKQVSDNISDGFDAFSAVVEATVHRARPVVLTALATALAFIPLTFDSFWGPLAFVLIGGVLAGTGITLLFVPALYALWFRLDQK